MAIQHFGWVSHYLNEEFYFTSGVHYGLDKMEWNN